MPTRPAYRSPGGQAQCIAIASRAGVWSSPNLDLSVGI